MNLLAQLFGAIATGTNVIGIQLKQKNQILFTYIISGVFFIVSFYLLGAYSGVATCVIMTIETYINYLFDKRNKIIPKWLIYVMIIVAVGISSLFYQSWVDLLSIISCIPFVLMLVQKKEKNVRLFTFIFLLLYTTFDILVGAYTTFIGDIVFQISTIIAIIRYDLRKANK